MASYNLYKCCALAACTMALMCDSLYIRLMCDIAHLRYVVRTYLSSSIRGMHFMKFWVVVLSRRLSSCLYYIIALNMILILSTSIMYSKCSGTCLLQGHWISESLPRIYLLYVDHFHDLIMSVV